MEIARFSQFMILLSTVLNFISPAFAGTTIDESDAMQITTNFNNLTGIACDSTAQYCVSVGVISQAHQIDHVVYTTSNGGIKWSKGFMLPHPNGEDPIEEPKNSNQNIMQIRCDTSGQNCLIAGATSIAKQSQLVTYTTHDGGQTWTAPNLLSYPKAQKQILTDDYPFLRLKCSANLNWCVLASNTIMEKKTIPVVFTTQNGGESWSSAILNAPTNANGTNLKEGLQMLDLGCDQSGLFCTALTTNMKDQYSAESTPPLSLIYSTHDGGITWSDAKPLMLNQTANSDPIASEDVLHILSCDRSSGLRCIALGVHYSTDEKKITTANTHAYLTKNGGLSWQDTTAIPSTDTTHMNIFTSLHCDVSNRFCAAVGMSVDQDGDKDFPIIYTTIDGGQTWQKKTFTSPNDALNLMLDVFCSDDAAFCHAVGIVL
ncbi:MAG: hypothetical protein ACO1N3_04985 [Gammaproteobacteria bacterium]